MSSRAIFASKIPKIYDASTKALDILKGKDLTGKLAIITGASNGIGLETAKSLIFHGCMVIFACRSKETTTRAIASIEEERMGSSKYCKFIKCDLASLNSVQEFTEDVQREIEHIDYLILNAGCGGSTYSQTEGILM